MRCCTGYRCCSGFICCKGLCLWFMITCFIGCFNDILIEGYGTSILFGGVQAKSQGAVQAWHRGWGPLRLPFSMMSPFAALLLFSCTMRRPIGRTGFSLFSQTCQVVLL